MGIPAIFTEFFLAIIMTISKKQFYHKFSGSSVFKLPIMKKIQRRINYYYFIYNNADKGRKNFKILFEILIEIRIEYTQDFSTKSKKPKKTFY